MNPPQPPSIPSCELALVLRELQIASFESLRSTDLKILSMKTLLLVALASIKRVGDMRAFSFDETLSSLRLATVHRQNTRPQDLRPAICLLRRPAERKGCLQAEDGPLDSGRHCPGLPSTRHALPAQVACPLYERHGILLGAGSWCLADRYL